MSQRGKVAAKSQDRVRAPEQKTATAAASPVASSPKKEGCGCGCKPGDAVRSASPAPVRDRVAARVKPRGAIVQSVAKAAALARRKAQSTRGKAGIGAQGMTTAQTARATNPSLSSRELAQAVREARSKRGSAGQKKSQPCGRRRNAIVSANKAGEPGPAKDQPWKVGATETGRGQTVTGTMVGRDRAVTGDEPSTCRSVTGTEYLGADIFREFCQAEPAKQPMRSSVTSTARGNRVTGNEVGRSSKVTGDEPGTCKRVTGTEYVSAEQSDNFCGVQPEKTPSRLTSVDTQKGKSVTGNNVGQSAKVTGGEAGAGRELTGTQYTNVSEATVLTKSAPAKVGQSKTLRGGRVSGTMVGRRERMTGDEAGSCRNITGDDYISGEQYEQFCEAGDQPAPKDNKVGMTRTLKGEAVTGTMTGRSMKVTGDEPGTCKAITGTPYAGREQYATWCETDDAQAAQARMQPARRNFGSVMTGKQPGIRGSMTGDQRGACEPVTGTPYVGADQAAEACPAVPAEPGSPDFPQLLDGAAPWEAFSVTPPAHASQGRADPSSRVTGSRYEDGGQITGPFGMALNKVTGTEEARFGHSTSAMKMPETAESVDGRVKSRITGEGMDVGQRITGDDWDRGDRVTGTEGASALKRNPTRRGSPTGPMGFRARERNEAAEPVSKVTGSSGNTVAGAMITYSGGARG